MSTLHLVSTAEGLTTCLGAVSPGEPVVLLGAARVALTNADQMDRLTAAATPYALEFEDALPLGVQPLDMPGLVALVTGTARSVSWAG